MVIAQYRLPWFSDDQLGVPMEIHKVNEVKGKFGPEIELELQDPHYKFCKVSCYGQNLNALITAFGADTDNWLKKRIEIEKQDVKWKGQEKTLKVFRAL